MSKYTVKRCNDHIFFFKHEPTQPDLLHIYVRHLTNEEHAIAAFFTGIPTWNQARERWETTSLSHTVYWFWLDQEQKKVMIITCFNT